MRYLSLCTAQGQAQHIVFIKNIKCDTLALVLCTKVAIGLSLMVCRLRPGTPIAFYVHCPPSTVHGISNAI
jgi:hypothetical protein